MAASRASLPQEFYDKTSDMLLVQPEPQYLYAQLWLGAMNASLTTPDQMGLAGREAPSVGASYDGLEKSRLMLSNPMITEVIAAKFDFNGAPGNTIRVNRPAFTNSTYTSASRVIPVGSTISTTPIEVKSEQNSITLFRFGGPYSGSAVAPYAIESFDANMGVHKLANIVGNSLKRDFHRFLDKVNVDLLDGASSALYPEGMTAVNDAASVGSFAFTYELLSRTEQTMDDANLPTFGDGFRAYVGTPTQIKQLKDDPQFQRYAQHFPQFNALFPQYVASVGKFHIFKSTTLSTTANSSSVNIHYGHAIAPGALMAGMGRPVHVMAATDDNYGETVKVIWLGDMAFGLADNRFVISVRSSA